MLSLKQGVKLKDLSPQIVLAAFISTWCFIEEGYNTVITSANDSTHGKHSLHYTGNAIDLRTKHIPDTAQSVIKTIVEKLKANLGNNFDVVLEKDHIHIEYDAKE